MTRALRLAVRDVIDSPIKDSPGEIRPIDGGPGFDATQIFRLYSNLVDEKTQAPITYTRSTAAIYRDIYGVWRKKAANEAPSTGAGTIFEGDGENLCTNYSDGSSLTGSSRVSGDGADPALVVPGAVSGVDFTKVQPLVDDGTLSAAFVLDCSAATVETVYKFTGGTVDTSAHSFSIFGASIGGDSELGLTASKASPVSISGAVFDRVTSDNVTPGAAAEEVHVFVPAGVVCAVGINQLENSKNSTSPMICLGGSFNRVAANARFANGTDNYCKYSRDLTKSPWSAPGAATIDDFETITFPASAAALDRVQYAMQDTTEAGGTYSAFIEVFVTSGTKDARVRMIDNAGTTTLFTDFTATTEKQWVPVDQITFNAASSFRALYIQNDSVGTAGELKVSNVIITSRPVRPENLPTDGAARIYELGNMCADAENIGGGSWVNGSLTVTPNYGVAPDGRQKTTLIDDQSAIASFNTNYTFPVADDTQPREASAFIRKQVGPISHYFGFRMQYQTGGSTINRFCAFDAVGGIVTAYNAGSELSVRVEDWGGFWRLVGTMSNNGTGNTELFCVLYPALNSDGTGAADVTATGAAEVWGFQVKDYDVESSNYCPAWGAPRKLRFGEIWENRVWMRISFPEGILDNGAVQVFYDDYIDSSNFNRGYYSNATNKIIFQTNVAGTPYTAVRDYAGDGTPFDVLMSIDPDEGMRTLITGNPVAGTSSNKLDLPRNNYIRLGALQAGTVPMYAPGADVKWGVLPAGGVDLERVSCV